MFFFFHNGISFCHGIVTTVCVFAERASNISFDTSCEHNKSESWLSQWNLFEDETYEFF